MAGRQEVELVLRDLVYGFWEDIQRKEKIILMSFMGSNKWEDQELFLEHLFSFPIEFQEHLIRELK